MDETAIKVPVAATAGKVNPILKKNPHHQGSAAASSAAGGADSNSKKAPSSPSGGAATKRDADGKPTTPGRDKKHLTWDEHAIEEHDLLRGTRMKVKAANIIFCLASLWRIFQLECWGSRFFAFVPMSPAILLTDFIRCTLR